VMDLSFYLPVGGDLFRRVQEEHCLRLHSVRELTAMLRRTGFCDICVEGEDGTPKPEEERLFFMARRPAGEG